MRGKSCRPQRSSIAGMRGQALVEIALIAPVLLFSLLGMIDIGSLFFTYEGITNAAREGARYAASQPTDTAGILTHVKQEVGTGTALDPNSIKVASVTTPSGTLAGNPVNVRVEYDFSPLVISLLPFVPQQLKIYSTASMAIVNGD